MTKKISANLAGLFLIAMSFGACQKNCETTPTYDANIKAIIDANCTLSGCHGNGSTAGGVSTDSYSNLQASLNNGTFESEVLTTKDMPRNGSLSSSELDLIRCWKDGGYPEN